MKHPVNLLDCIPQHRGEVRWEYGRAGEVILYRQLRFWSGWAARWLDLPKEQTIGLDELGGYVWELMDGRRCVEEIGRALSAQYGARAEPLFARLALYLRMLCRQRLIRIKTE